MTTYCFDIDGTICSQEEDYLKAVPNTDRIRSINLLYEAGHHIKFFTARGSVSGIDWRQETERQLRSWGVRYHELLLGKPHADLYVDDKGVSSEEFTWH